MPSRDIAAGALAHRGLSLCAIDGRSSHDVVCAPSLVSSLSHSSLNSRTRSLSRALCRSVSRTLSVSLARALSLILSPTRSVSLRVLFTPINRCPMVNVVPTRPRRTRRSPSAPRRARQPQLGAGCILQRRGWAPQPGRPSAASWLLRLSIHLISADHATLQHMTHTSSAFAPANSSTAL